MDRALSCENREGATGKDQVLRLVGRDTELIAVERCKVLGSILLFPFSQNVATEKDFLSCHTIAHKQVPRAQKFRLLGALNLCSDFLKAMNVPSLLLLRPGDLENKRSLHLLPSCQLCEVVAARFSLPQGECSSRFGGSIL